MHGLHKQVQCRVRLSMLAATAARAEGSACAGCMGLNWIGLDDVKSRFQRSARQHAAKALQPKHSQKKAGLVKAFFHHPSL